MCFLRPVYISTHFQLCTGYEPTSLGGLKIWSGILWKRKWIIVALDTGRYPVSKCFHCRPSHIWTHWDRPYAKYTYIDSCVLDDLLTFTHLIDDHYQKKSLALPVWVDLGVWKNGFEGLTVHWSLAYKLRIKIHGLLPVVCSSGLLHCLFMHTSILQQAGNY